MPFYKATLRAGHVGTNRYQDFTSYVQYNSYIEAMNHIKEFPMVKRTRGKAIQSLEQIDELEFIVGIIQNAYYYMSSKEIGRMRSLEDMIIMLNKLDKDCSLETNEGKELKGFCDRYIQADNKQKKKINKEYIEWASNLIKEYENQKYNFPKI